MKLHIYRNKNFSGLLGNISVVLSGEISVTDFRFAARDPNAASQ